MFRQKNVLSDQYMNVTHIFSCATRKSTLLFICLLPSLSFFFMYLYLEMYWLAAGCVLLLVLFYSVSQLPCFNNYKVMLYALLIFAFLLEQVAAYFLEWEMGFQNYLFALVPIGFVFLYRSNNYRDIIITGITSSSLIMICFLFCNMIDYQVEPTSGASHIVIRAISAVNSVLIILILFSCMILFVMELYSAHRKLLEEANARLDGLRGSMMLSQIKPHFLYNTLGAIDEMIDTDPVRAKSAMADFTRYMRMNIDCLTNNEQVPFKKELSHINAFMQIQNLRFGDAISIEYDIACEDFMLPPLTIQPLVENAIKHGIRPKGGIGKIRLSVREDAQSYIISVADDGVGMNLETPHQTSGSTGLYNIEHRLKTMCNGYMEIVSVPEVGTTLTVIIPKQHKETV